MHQQRAFSAPFTVFYLFSYTCIISQPQYLNQFVARPIPHTLKFFHFLMTELDHNFCLKLSKHLMSISSTCLRVAFTCADPKSIKIQSSHKCLFALSGPMTGVGNSFWLAGHIGN